MNKLKLVYRRGGQTHSVILEQTDIKLGKKGAGIELPDEPEIADIHAQIKWDAETKAYTVIREHKDYPLIDQHEQDVPEIVLNAGVVFRIGTIKFVCLPAETAGPNLEQSTTPQEHGRGDIKPLTDAPSLQSYFPNNTLYRIALLGWKSSGKTCFLTALSFPHLPSKETRSSCLRHPALPKPTQRDPAYEDFIRGADILNEAVEKMWDRFRPESNSTGDTGRYIFELSTPDRPGMIVETIDYAGEHITQKSDEEAARIQDILYSADGLILFAQIPLTGAQPSHVLEDLTNLASAFQRVKGGGPVVVAINKWDRRQSFDPENATLASEQKALEEYLGTPDGGTLKGLVSKIEDSMGKDNVRIMPVSALGKCEVVEVPDPKNEGGPYIKIERPQEILPLRPFGLLEPFLWLIQQADNKAVEGYEKRVNSISLKRPWRVLWSPEARKVREVQHNLHMRNMVDHDLKKRLRRADNAFRRKTFWAKTSLVAAGLLLLAMAEFAFSSGKHIRAARQLPLVHVACTNTYSKAKANEDILSSYGSNSVRHRLSKLYWSAETVGRIINGSRQRRKEFLISSIATTNNAPEKRIECLRLYQQDFRGHPDYSGNMDLWRTSIGGKLLATITNVNAGYEVRLANAGLFLDAWPDDSESRNVERIKKDLEDGKKYIEATGNYQTTLNGIQHALQSNFVSGATIGIRIQAIQSELEGELLVAVNKAVSGVLFDDRIVELQRYRDLFHANQSLANIDVVLKQAIDRLNQAKQDKQQYDALTKSSDIERATAYRDSNEIPVFMSIEVRQHLAEPLLVIESIKWESRPWTGKKHTFIFQSGSYTTNKIIKSSRRKKNVQINWSIPIISANKPVSIMMIYDKIGRDNPKFESFISVNLLGATTTTQRLNQTTGSDLNVDILMKMSYQAKLPREWQPRRYKRLDSMEWE